jgi:hypothetical protein
MIVIKDQDFLMEQVKNLPFFDLKMPSIVNEGKENERKELKIVAYAIPFEECIKTIIATRLNKTGKNYTMKSYMKAFVEEVTKFKDLYSFSLPPSKMKKDESEDVDDN